ncbi:MAG TPA: undecaprenyl-diphosphate phosphatase, partial [Candidatus Saccharimonadales bacterium]|nr:undecaprenyl-diphosphate phosphatase [Candidatus Saccharimonadales bacterium]
QKLFGLDPERFGLTFDVALHMGTLLAVFLYFFRTWVGLVRDLLSGRWRVPLLLVIGTIPGAIAGVLLEGLVSRELRSPLLIAAMLVVGSAIFILAERLGTQRRGMGTLSFGDALLIGTAQAIALVPGLSRSGMTISAGLGSGLRRGEATAFSFLLSTPIIAGAGAKTLLDLRKASVLFEQPGVVAVGFVVSFLAGLAAVSFLVRLLRGHTLAWFVPYRVAVAVAIVIAVALGAL